MFLSRHSSFRTSAFGGLTVAALLVASQTASAAPPTAGYYTYRYGYNPGYYGRTGGAPPSPYAATPFAGKTQSLAPSWFVPAGSPAPAPLTAARPSGPAAAESGGLTVVVKAPPQPAPLAVNLRGPDGTVRRFPLEGGREAIQSREVIVHAGESATFRFLVEAPTK
jgi:hypothetical protein